MICSPMSQFYHGLVIQRGPWEDQFIVQPSYTQQPSSVLGGASHTDSASRFGLINNLDRKFQSRLTMPAQRGKYNMHMMTGPQQARIL